MPKVQWFHCNVYSDFHFWAFPVSVNVVRQCRLATQPQLKPTGKLIVKSRVRDAATIIEMVVE